MTFTLLKFSKRAQTLDLAPLKAVLAVF